MKTISAFMLSILVFSFIFAALPQTASAQPVPFEGCCQFINSCETLSQDACIANPESMEFFINEECSPNSNRCPSFVGEEHEISNVPTLSQWGLIAMAGAIGIIGFIVMRRRTASADI